MNKLENSDCLYPSSLDEALRLLADSERAPVILAGGTDLMVLWESGALDPPSTIVSVAALPELSTIVEREKDIVIGSCVTHRRLMESALVRRYLPALALAAASVGAVQIQNMGTIGGSVANASPAGDLAPALLVTGGELVAASSSGERKIALNDFYRGYRDVDLGKDELIVRFVLPKLRPGDRGLFSKLGTRRAQAISKVMGACRVALAKDRIEMIRLSLGSVAPVPVRLPLFEEWAHGRVVDPHFLNEVEKRVSDEIHPIDDIRSTGSYRRWVAGRIARGFFERLRSP